MISSCTCGTAAHRTQTITVITNTDWGARVDSCRVDGGTLKLDLQGSLPTHAALVGKPARLGWAFRVRTMVTSRPWAWEAQNGCGREGHRARGHLRSGSRSERLLGSRNALSWRFSHFPRLIHPVTDNSGRLSPHLFPLCPFCRFPSLLILLHLGAERRRRSTSSSVGGYGAARNLWVRKIVKRPVKQRGRRNGFGRELPWGE